MIPTDALPADRACQLTSNGATISEQDLITQLATARKPVACAAQIGNGKIEVTWQPLENVPHAFDFHKRCLEDTEAYGGFMGFVVQRHGGTRQSNSVLCAGVGEAMVLPLDVVERWSADYAGFSYSADDVDNPNAADDPLYQKARALSAYGILRFSPPGRADVRITISLDPPTRAEGFEEAARRCDGDAADLEGFLPMFVESERMRPAMDHFASECRLFFGAALPPKLAAVLVQWDELKRQSAA